MGPLVDEQPGRSNGLGVGAERALTKTSEKAMTRCLLSFTFSRKDVEQLPWVNASSAHWTEVSHSDVGNNGAVNRC